MNSDSLNMVSRLGEGHMPCNFFLSEPQLKTTVDSPAQTTADAHFTSKNTLLKRNTLHCYILLKRTVCFKLACYSLLFNTLYPSTHFASWNVFSSAQFASQHPLLLKTPCSSTHFASQHTLLLRTLCSSAHFASKNTLLLRTLYSSTHFAS